MKGKKSTQGQKEGCGDSCACQAAAAAKMTEQGQCCGRCQDDEDMVDMVVEDVTGCCGEGNCVEYIQENGTCCGRTLCGHDDDKKKTKEKDPAEMIDAGGGGCGSGGSCCRN